MNNVETSWALGATFDYFRNFNIHWGQLAVSAASTERDSLSLCGFPSCIHPPSVLPPHTQSQSLLLFLFLLLTLPQPQHSEVSLRTLEKKKSLYFSKASYFYCMWGSLLVGWLYFCKTFTFLISVWSETFFFSPTYRRCRRKNKPVFWCWLWSWCTL